MTVLAERSDLLPFPRAEFSIPEGYELVDGALVEKQMGAESDWIAGELRRLLGNWNAAHRPGWVFGGEAGYQCFPEDPRKVRKPDVSFIRRERLRRSRPPKGYVGVAPDLAVEVVSPNDLFSEVMIKVAEYLRAGVERVWVVDPETRTALVWCEGTVAYLRESDELSGGALLPGFRCRVGDLFPLVEEVAEQEA